MSNICRLCLDIAPHRSINFPYDTMSLTTKIKFVLPELDISVVSLLILCTQCWESLNKAYIFKTKCLEVEETIQQYLKKFSNPLPLLDLHDIRNQKLQNENDNECKKITQCIKVQRKEDLKLTKACDVKNDINYELEGGSLLDDNCFVPEIGANNTEINYTCDKCETLFFDELIFQAHAQNCKLYHCDKCNTALSSQNKLDEHMKHHINIEEFSSKICSKPFENTLKKHTLIYTGNIHSNQRRKYICIICHRDFQTPYKLKRHKDTHANERKYTCTVCKKSFKVYEYLQRHVIFCHNIVKKHICEICGMQCISKTVLSEHLQTHISEKPYKCEFCGKRFAVKDNLNMHVSSTHNNEKPFICEICGNTFTLKDNLESHMAVHVAIVKNNLNYDIKENSLLDKDDISPEETDVNKSQIGYACEKCDKTFCNRILFEEHYRSCSHYKCYECKTTFLSEHQLDEHQQQQHLFLKTFSCEICSKTFKTNYSLKQHALIHTEIKSVVCNECDKRFYTKKKLREHSTIHSGHGGKYICIICNRSFQTPSKLKRHKDTHAEERKYSCTICKKSFKVSEYLQRHVVVCHIGMKKHTCEVCGMKCISKAVLSEHLRIHTGEKPYKCEVCGKGFTQRSTLTVHVKSIHNDEKPFECEVCGKTFTLKGNLKSHMIIHMDGIEKKHVCTHCGKNFRFNKDLQSHVRRHLGIKTHTCPICNKGFIGSTALKIHMRSHTGERPYECDICNKTFSQKHNLKVHLRCHKPKVL